MGKEFNSVFESTLLSQCNWQQAVTYRGKKFLSQYHKLITLTNRRSKWGKGTKPYNKEKLFIWTLVFEMKSRLCKKREKNGSKAGGGSLQRKMHDWNLLFPTKKSENKRIYVSHRLINRIFVPRNRFFRFWQDKKKEGRTAGFLFFYFPPSGKTW